MNTVVFLDVNVFMYAAGTEHPYKEPCVRILSDVEMGVLVATINTEILQELLYRYSHIGMAKQGIRLCREILKYPLTVLPVTEVDVRQAIELFGAWHTAGVSPRDAIHAATMRDNGISRLISADRGFDHLDFITWLDPLAYTSRQ